MLYMKNKAAITGQVVCLGLKHNGVDIALVLVNTKNIIPINITNLGMNLKLNSVINITGEVKTKDNFTYVEATNIEQSKSKSLKHIVELTGVLKSHIKDDLYEFEISKDNVVVISIPVVKPGIVKLNSIVNVKAEFRSMNYINRNTINLSSCKLICNKYTNI